MDTKPGKVGADDYIAAGRGADLPAIPRTGPSAIEPVELHALLARTYNEPPAIIGGGVIPRQGFVIVGGPPKRGKSLLVLSQLLARSVGCSWLGFPTTPGRSVLLQAEIPERELQTRTRLTLESLGQAVPPDLPHFVTERRLRLDRPAGLRSVRHLIEGLTPDLLVIDPLARFLSGDENNTREMGRLIAGLDELIQAYGVAVELVHHTALPKADDPREGGLRLRGSSALFAAADSALILDRDGADRFRLTFELRHARQPDPLRLRRVDPLALELAGPPEELLAVAAAVHVIPLSYGQLVAAIRADQDVSKPTAERRLKAALQAGLITKNGDGGYRSAQNGQPHALTPTSLPREGEGKC
jgi:hypothetical protein